MFFREPFTSLNAGLRTTQFYDVAPIKDQILRLSGLRAFYDFTDVSTMTLSGALIGQVNDQGPNGLHLTATLTDRPTWVPGALGHAGAALFYDNKMSNDALFSGGDWGALAIGFRATAADGTTRMLACDASDTQASMAVQSTSVRGFGNDVIVSVAALNDRNVQPIWAWDYSGATEYVKIVVDGAITMDTTTYNKPNGKGNIGAYADAQAGNRFRGYITHAIHLDTDASADPAVLALLQEYGRRALRVPVV